MAECLVARRPSHAVAVALRRATTKALFAQVVHTVDNMLTTHSIRHFSLALGQHRTAQQIARLQVTVAD